MRLIRRGLRRSSHARTVRAMQKPILFAVSSALVLAACGEPTPAKSPDAFAETETTGQPDMPPPAPKDGEEAAGDAPATTDAKGPEGGMLAVAAMAFEPAKKGKADKPLALAADGTISVEGKPAGKIAGDEVQDASGANLLTVGVDGSLVGAGVTPGTKFEGDELVTDKGTRLAVTEDGTLTATTDGKSETLGKFEGGAKAKRAALLVAFLHLEAAKAAPATPAKPAKK
jgi:hypothetical protein